MQKKHLAAISLFVYLSLHLAQSTLAASPAPSPSLSPSPASMSEVTENLKKRLQASLDPDNPVAASSLRGYVGIVKDVIGDAIIMDDKDGKRDVKIKDDTTIVRSPGNATIKAENIRLGDYIIAIGYPGESEILSGKRLILSADEFKPPAKAAGMGTITQIGKTTLAIKIQDKVTTLTLTSKTLVKSPAASLELADLAVGDTIIYTATGPIDSLTATVIMRISSSTL